MSSPALEAFLARLYTDPDLLRQFLHQPEVTALGAGLDAAEASALRNIDRAGLQMAAESYARKRAQHRRPKSLIQRVQALFRRLS